MIFITIGSAFPFDRLIQSMDDWAVATGRSEECLAQIGDGSYEPKSMRWERTLSHGDYAASIKASKVVVSHAGMGSVITAMRSQVPIVMLPRRFEAGEQHVAERTVHRFENTVAARLHRKMQVGH